jgi:nitrogen fixation protein FixH
MNLIKSGRIWPYTITFLIIMVFGFCVATVYVTSKAPVEKADLYMTSYQDADANANKLIEDRIAFNKRFKIEFLTKRLFLDDTVIEYKITDLDSNPVKNAKIKVIVTRPNEHKYDMELNNPKYENGVYRFESIKLPLEGRWDIMAKINIGEFQRFYNLKADTRYKKVKQY